MRRFRERRVRSKFWGRAPSRLGAQIPKRAWDWDRIRAKRQLVSPALSDFVGLSFQYADSCLGYDDARRGDPALVSTIKIRRAGFHEFIDTQIMLQKWFRDFPGEAVPPAGLKRSDVGSLIQTP